MLLAAVETSTDWCSVALWLDGDITACERRVPNRHAELALPMLERLLARAKRDASALDAIAFGAGPGSFTGLRIACGIAQGLAFARALPVLGVSTLEAIAEEAGSQRVLACIDARMREVYYAALEKTASGWRYEIEPQCVPPHAVPRPPGEGWIGAGNGFAAYPELKIPGMLRAHAEIHPSAAAVARLGAPRLAAGEGVDPALAVPLYVRDKVAFTTKELAGR
jgi:tRNA threonylcarbamoyladenosine biosynthesis protein TsaB